MPRMPFSDWRTTSSSAGMWFAMSVGMPMPRLTVFPSAISLTARRTMPSRSSATLGLPHGAPLDPLLARRDDQPVDVDAGRVDRVRVELARLDELLDLGDARAAGGRGHRVEVARGAVVH